MMLAPLVVAPLSLATLTTTTNYTDTFNTYSDNSAPSQSWYTFYTTFTYAKVNRTINASYPFYVNASTTAPTSGLASFNFSAYAYDYFQYSFTYLNAYANKRNHSGMRFTLKGNSANIAYVDVYGDNASVPANKNRLLILNESGVVKRNVSIKKGILYTVTYTPDYDNNLLNITVYNTSSSTYLTKIDVTLKAQTTLNRFFMANYPNSQRTAIFLENFDLQKTYSTATQQTTNYMTQTILPILISVAILGVIVAVAFTMGLSKESLITLMIITIIGIVVISIITGL